MFKKFIRGVLCLIMLSCVAFTVSSCDKFRIYTSNDVLEKDSVLIAKKFKALQNPEFKTVDELVYYQSDVKQNFTNDSIFRTIPEQALREIAGVVLKREGFLDKSVIVGEYKDNYDKVYKYLPDKKQEEAKDTTKVTVKDTVVNGKIYRFVR